jgi:hypothetical protein
MNVKLTPFVAGWQVPHSDIAALFLLEAAETLAEPVTQR